MHVVILENAFQIRRKLKASFSKLGCFVRRESDAEAQSFVGFHTLIIGLLSNQSIIFV